MTFSKCSRKNCKNPATHIIINKDGNPTTTQKLCCEDYMRFIDKESKECLIRNCSVCGKKLKIRLYNDGHYKGGNYFGKIRPALKWAKKVHYSTIAGRRLRVRKVLKYGPGTEYWECEKCYNEPEKK